MRAAATLAVFPRMLHDVPLVVGAAAALLAVHGRETRGRAAFPLALLALLALLVLNGRTSTLPFSFLLYPDRTAVLALYPLALLAHEALATRSRRWLAAGACAAIAVHAAILQTRTVRTGRENALATPDDLRALAAAGLPSGCAVINNYGDAGQWIPALLALPITFPQVNAIFFDEVSATVHPCAAFRGEKRPYHLDTVPCPGPACESAIRVGGAELFRIVDPALEVRIEPAR